MNASIGYLEDIRNAIEGGLSDVNANVMDVEAAVKELDAAMLPTLERIAVALETIAGDITARRELDATSLRSQHEHLRTEVSRTSYRFGKSDAALCRMVERGEPQSVIDQSNAYNNQCEHDMMLAQAKLDDFEAAHPELAAFNG